MQLSDVVAQLGFLGSLALHAEMQKQSHDAKGHHCTSTSNEEQDCQADGSLLAGLHHATLLPVKAGLAEALPILANATEVAIICTFPDLHTSVSNIVDLWDTKLLASRRSHCMFLVGRHIDSSMLGDIGLARKQAELLSLVAAARLKSYRCNRRCC